MKDCHICLQDYKEDDLVSLLSCGHYIHNRCYIRLPLDYKYICSFCKQHVRYESNYIYKKGISSELDIFDISEESMQKFDKTVEHIKSNKQEIFNLFRKDYRDKRNELFEEQNQAIKKYVKTLLASIKTHIIYMVNTGITNRSLYILDHTERLNDKFPLFYYIYGPITGDLSYLRDNNVTPLLDELYTYFNRDLYEFSILDTKTTKRIVELEVNIL